jgi:hypothetical protein
MVYKRIRKSGIMKKYMKSSKIKKIVVKCANFWMDEIEVDSEIFDDIYVEAVTRAVERRKSKPGFTISFIIEAWEKKDFADPYKHYVFNTYKILINAGMHRIAEIIRMNFLKENQIDLRYESLRSDTDDERPRKQRKPRAKSTKSVADNIEPQPNIEQSNTGSLGN